METRTSSRSGRSLRGYFSKKQASTRTSEDPITETLNMDQPSLGIHLDPNRPKAQYLKEVSIVSHDLGHNTRKLKRKADAIRQSQYDPNADSLQNFSAYAKSSSDGRIIANTDQPTEFPIQEYAFKPKTTASLMLAPESGPPAKRARRSKEDRESLLEDSLPNAPLDVSTTASIKATFPKRGYLLSDYNLSRVLHSGLNAKQRCQMYPHDFNAKGVPKTGRNGRGKPALIEKEGKQYYAVVCGSIQLHGGEGTAMGLNVMKGKKITTAINETLGDERVSGSRIPAREMGKKTENEEAASNRGQSRMKNKRESIIDEGVLELSSSDVETDNWMEDTRGAIPEEVVSYIKDIEEQAIEWQNWGKKTIAAMGTAKALRGETSTARQGFKDITGKYRAAREKVGENWLKAIKEN